MSVWSLIKEGVELFKNKKFGEAIEKLNQALGKIEDKNSQIQEQNVIQLGLGRCYLEQAMKAKGKESEQLLSRAVEHFQRLLEFTKQLEDKQNRLQQQIYAQSWLGRCYLEQAKQAKEKDSKQLFERAVEHHQQQLGLAEQLADEQNRLQEQINAQSWLGRCYLEQAKQAKEKDSKQLFERAVEHHQQQLGLAEQLADEQNRLQEQINAQSWLGRCYLEQAKQAKEKDSKQLFERAVEHHQQQLGLAEQLADEQNRLQEQINAQSWLGRCYFEQAMKTEGKEAAKLFEQAVEHFEPQLELAKQLTDEQNHLRQQNNAQLYLGRCYFEQAKIQQKWERYFDWKKQKIQGDLFGTQEGTQKEKTVIDDITTILAVLNIPPMELGSIPLSEQICAVLPVCFAGFDGGGISGRPQNRHEFLYFCRRIGLYLAGNSSSDRDADRQIVWHTLSGHFVRPHDAEPPNRWFSRFVFGRAGRFHVQQLRLDVVCRYAAGGGGCFIEPAD